MIDKKIFKIALETENLGNIKNHTHYSSLKNSLCGDEIKIYLLIKNNKIENFKYEGDSCIYCQASASLLSKIAKKKSINAVNNFIKKSKNLFDKKIKISDKKWISLIKIMNDKNSSRKDCLLLPLKATTKALKN
tara:strand:+ start:606 stop:1007 length:402 start_codon:yes stop_codon:yes gene_type:complete